MKKIFLKTPAVAGILSLLLLLPAVKHSPLTDITKPYLGEYECKQARLGETDYLQLFSYIKLELKKDGNYTLHYKEKAGKKKTVNGKYRYDAEKKALIFKEEGGVEREFALTKGQLSVLVPLGEKTLFLIFEQK